jgi:WD40 repeat protein
MGKWKRQPPLTPEQLPSEIRQVERVLETIEQELATEIAREEAIIEQERYPAVTHADSAPTPVPVIPSEPESPACKETKMFLYVMDYSNTMYIIDPAKGEVVQTIPIGDGNDNYILMQYDPLHNRIFLHSINNNDKIYVWDVDTERIIATLIVTDQYGMIGIDQAHNLLYIPIDGDPGFVAIYDLTTEQVVTLVHVSDNPDNVQIVWIEPISGTVYVLGADNANATFKLWKINPETNQVTIVNENTAFNGWYGATADMLREKIYVTGESVVGTFPIIAAVDLRTETTTIHDLPDFGMAEVDASTGNILLEGEHDLYVIDPVTFTSNHFATLAGNTYYPNVSNVSSYENIWYTLTSADTIIGYDLATGAEVFQIALDIDHDTNQVIAIVAARRCIQW